MTNQSAAFMQNSDQYINTTTFCGEAKRTIISKDFKGGKVNNMFGSTELDFTYADIIGTAVLDVSQACGEVVIVVPRDWVVQPHLSHFCSATDDDRRYQTNASDLNKILVIKGLSVFGVLEIVSV